MIKLFGAIDLGASSGRVIAGVIGDGKLEMHEVHRFANEPVTHSDGFYWDYPALQREISSGLAALGRYSEELGLEVLQRGRRENGTGFIYFDTVEETGAVLMARQSTPSPS